MTSRLVRIAVPVGVAVLISTVALFYYQSSRVEGESETSPQNTVIKPSLHDTVIEPQDKQDQKSTENPIPFQSSIMVTKKSISADGQTIEMNCSDPLKDEPPTNEVSSLKDINGILWQFDCPSLVGEGQLTLSISARVYTNNGSLTLDFQAGSAGGDGGDLWESRTWIEDLNKDGFLDLMTRSKLLTEETEENPNYVEGSTSEDHSQRYISKQVTSETLEIKIWNESTKTFQTKEVTENEKGQFTKYDWPKIEL